MAGTGMLRIIYALTSSSRENFPHEVTVACHFKSTFLLMSLLNHSNDIVCITGLKPGYYKWRQIPGYDEVLQTSIPDKHFNILVFDMMRCVCLLGVPSRTCFKFSLYPNVIQLCLVAASYNPFEMPSFMFLS